MKLILILCPNLKFEEFCSGIVIFCTIHYSIAYSMVHIFCNTSDVVCFAFANYYNFFFL